METHGVTMFYELCRLCLKDPGKNTISETEDLSEDIFVYTGVRVSAQDNLPQKICSNCQNIIKQSKDLRILALNNDSHLRFLFEDETANQSTVIATSTNLKPTDKQNETEMPSSTTNTNASEPKAKLAVRKDLFTNPPSEEREHKDRKKEKHKHKGKSRHKEKERSSRQSSPDEIKRESSSPKKMKSEEGEGDSKELYKCEQCGKEFRLWRRFYFHQRTHMKRFGCPLDGCGKMFATKGDLDKHVRVHTGAKPFVCALCERGFAQNVTLRQHMFAVHQGISE